MCKSLDIYLKCLTSAAISGHNSVKVFFFFAIKRLSAHSKALHILSKCIKTFQMSYQRPMSAFFHSDPNPFCLDTPKFHYLSDLWVAPKISCQVSKSNKKLLYNTKMRSIHINLNYFFQLKLSQKVYYDFLLEEKLEQKKKHFYNAWVTILQQKYKISNTKLLCYALSELFCYYKTNSLQY